MSELLSLKYRPATFSDLIGQNVTAVVLGRMVAEDKVPSGLFFTGPRGSGKTTSARILAHSLSDSDPIEVDAASHGSVADVRQMLDTLRFSAGEGKRVIIYDEAHSMSKEAFNALLKTLEEPPADTIFILVTTEPDKVPATVKSRLMEFAFRKVSPHVIYDRLRKVAEAENITVDNDLLILLAERADGSVRDALVSLDQCNRAGISTRNEFLNLAGERDVAHILVHALLTGDHAYIFETVNELSRTVPDPAKLASGVVSVLRDILVMRAGGSVDASPAALAGRKELVRLLEPERVLAAMRLLWDLKTKTRQSNDSRGNLDLVLVLVSEVLTRGRENAIKPPPRATTMPVAPAPKEAEPVAEPVRTLSLDEL